MSPEELKNTRMSLGLEPAEAAALLETHVSAIQKMEFPETAKQHRKPPARLVRLYRAYLAGYRPEDWPERLLGSKAARIKAVGNG